jgi:ABC-type transport system involved in multi-copper enzyme maturation permease subunit
MILTIAWATTREAVRSRTFLGLIIIYTVAVLLSRLVGWISATDGNVVTTDIIFSLQSVVGVLVAVATGTVLVHNEIQQKTLYTVLSRPLPRWHFVVGKYLGQCTALVVGQVAMLAIGLAYLAATGAEVHGWLLLAGALTIVEVLVMAGVSLCLTAVSTPLLAAVLSLAVYGLGHAVHVLPDLINHLHGVQLATASVLASLVPDLGQFAYRNQAVYRLPLDWSEVGERLAYGAAWIALLVTITISVFNRKQL